MTEIELDKDPMLAKKQSGKRRHELSIYFAGGAGTISLVTMVLIRIFADAPPLWIGLVLAAVLVGSFGYIILVREIDSRREDGVERFISTETAALGFWIVMFSAMAWASLESWLDLGKIDAATILWYGVVVSLILEYVHRRKLGIWR
jgi:hypothetical protein